MSETLAERMHKLRGPKRRRMTYQSKDFIDYTIMMAICAVLIYFTYGPSHFMTMVGLPLCLFMAIMFPIRHGITWSVPIIIKRPLEMFEMIGHKFQNARWMYYAAIALLLLENLLIHLTPEWPHNTELTHQIALYAFLAHFSVITLYRTVIFISHWIKSEHVKAVLMESTWKAQLKRQPNIKLEIVFGYVTGLLTHIVYLIPWFLVIRFAEFSLILMPITIAAGVFIHHNLVKVIGEWFYRDHWLGHNSEWEFVYSHGAHHDAIPSGMIAVAGNGPLEGFFRGAIGFPNPYFNPVFAAVLYTVDMYIDITEHQYIPGVFPKIDRDHRLIGQHSLHHFGRLEPFGFGFKVDQPGLPETVQKGTYKLLPEPLRNSISIDEQLSDYQWDSPRQRWYLALIDKYNDPGRSDTEDVEMTTDDNRVNANQ